jgi:DNA-directed RNA polymerase alpha subunit
MDGGGWHGLCKFQALPSGSFAMDDPILLADIAVLQLSERTTKILRANHLHQVGDLVRLPARKLFALSRLGSSTLREIVDRVDQQGLSLAD